MTKKIAVIGAGAWGTAIANLLANNNDKQILLWCLEKEVANDINNVQENKTYLKNIKLHKNIIAINDFKDLKNVEVVFLVVPVAYTTNILEQIAKENLIKEDVILVICSKGIDNKNLQPLSLVIAKNNFQKNPIAVMSGPNFADEIAKLQPAITTIACNDLKKAIFISNLLESDNFKPYLSDDIITAQIGGSIKNIIAIAMGIAEAQNFSQSSKAAILTKGLKEMSVITEFFSGKKETLLEPCAFGDLILTCSSLKSRNMSLGYEIGEGKKLTDILNNRATVAEGVATLKAIKKIMVNNNLENLDLINYIYQILFKNKKIELKKFI